MGPKDHTFRTTAPGYRPKSGASGLYDMHMPSRLQSLSANSQIHLQLFCMFLIISTPLTVEVFFVYFLAISFLLCDDCWVLAYFSIGLFVLSLLICDSSFYFMGMNPSLVIQIAKIFSQLSRCHFILFMLSFEEPKMVILT